MPLSQLIEYFNVRYHEKPLVAEHEGVSGHFQGLQLKSVFQPIKSLGAAAGEEITIGYEALLRVYAADNAPLSPRVAFAVAHNGLEVAYLDRLCRTLHTLNYLGQGLKVNHLAHRYLFLNVAPGHLLSVEQDHGQVFEDILHRCGISPHQVVIEIEERAISAHDSAHLKQAVKNYRHRGYRLALGNFGSEHGSLERVWSLEPDIIKLDRQFLWHARQNSRVRKILPKLVTLLHDLSSEVLIQGVEEKGLASLARDAGADLAQGYYFGMPQAHIDAAEVEKQPNRVLAAASQELTAPQ
jgi:EAL domain-containing protein (putative c-di-GMP-specific phosphodiesterase class I)